MSVWVRGMRVAFIVSETFTEKRQAASGSSLGSWVADLCALPIVAKVSGVPEMIRGTPAEEYLLTPRNIDESADKLRSSHHSRGIALRMLERS